MSDDEELIKISEMVARVEKMTPEERVNDAIECLGRLGIDRDRAVGIIDEWRDWTC